tara:strand:+ start:1033 stop:1824 length:792 start_codon:yes stop_codon:yes gene_type:complete
MGQPIPNIPVLQIYNTQIPDQRIWSVQQPFIPNVYPVTNHLGFPIVDIPGCVKAHKDNKKHVNGLPIDKSLIENDPGAVMTLCPAGEYPTFDAMNYEPEQLVIIREQEAPPVAPPPDPPGTPETPDTGNVAPEDPPCPGPNAQRIGTLGPNEKEKISGYELQPDPVNPGRKICVVLYEDIGPAEQFLPSAQVASTTAVIATVAGASALLAKPLADLLLRVFRPAIKQALTKVNAILGKSPEKPHRSDLRANEYRKKKGLPPLK